MDRAELERELERLHPDSYGWALACCRRDRDDAEEVLQTVYVAVLDGKARFEGRSSMKTWLFAVIRRTAAGHRRRRWLQKLRSWTGAIPERPDRSEAADRRIERSETSASLVSALHRLARRQREMLELVFYHDMTVDEASAALRISVGTGRVHYQRGKKNLLAILGGGERE